MLEIRYSCPGRLCIAAHSASSPRWERVRRTTARLCTSRRVGGILKAWLRFSSWAQIRPYQTRPKRHPYRWPGLEGLQVLVA
jgi:hypothetical protein